MADEPKEIAAKPPESVALTNNQENLHEIRLQTEKTRLINFLDTQGEILSEDNEFSQIVTKICTNLKLADNIDIFTIDTEDAGLAFYDAQAEAIALGKAVFTLLQQNGLTLCEDHIAAIITHETIHSLRNKKEKSGEKMKRDRYVSALKYNMAGHSQENEADREGMNLLAEAGYNPTAMIDIISHFTNLKVAGNTESHPSDYNRVTHLRDILFDDKHPLGNTDKPLTQISSTLAEWFNLPSDEVYETVDLIVNNDSSEIKKKLLEADSVEEFMVLLKGYKAALKTEKANALAQSTLLDRAVSESIALKFATDSSVVWKNQLLDNPLPGYFDSYRMYRDSRIVKERGIFVKDDNIDLEKPVFMTVRQFTANHQPNNTWVEKNNQTVQTNMEIARDEMAKIYNELRKKSADFFGDIPREIADEIRSIENRLNIIFDENNLEPFITTLQTEIDKTKDATIDNESIVAVLTYLQGRQIAKQVEDVFNGSTPTADMIGTIFPFRNKTLQQENLDREMAKATADHLPLPSQEFIDDLMSKLYDLDKLYKEFYQGLKESTARKVVLTDKIEEDILLKLSTFFNLPDTHLGAILLNGSENIADTLSQLTDGDLEKIFEIYINIMDINTGRLSPVRGSHAAYRYTLLDNDINPSEPYYNDTAIKTSELNPDLAYAIVSELRKRHLVQRDGARIFGAEYKVSDYDFSLENFAQLSKLDTRLAAFHRAKAVEELVAAYRSGSEPDEKILAVIGDVSDLNRSRGSGVRDVADFPYANIDLRADDIEILIEKCPWGEEITQKYLLPLISNNVCKFIGEAEDESDRSRLIATAKKFLDLTERHKVVQETSDLIPDDAKYNRGHVRAVRALRNTLMNNILKNELRNTPETAAQNTLLFCINEKVVRSISDIEFGVSSKFNLERNTLYPNSADVLKLLLKAKTEELQGIITQIITPYISDEDFGMNESLQLLGMFDPVDDEDTLFNLHGYSYNTVQLPERAQVLMGLSRGEVHPKLANKIISLHGDESLKWIKETFHSSFAQKRLMTAIASLRPNLYEEWITTVSDPDNKFENLHPDHTYARNTARYDINGYKGYSGEDLVATTQEEYDDLLTRRHPFRTLAYNAVDLDFNEAGNFGNVFPTDQDLEVYDSVDTYGKRGNIAQRLIAERLYQIQTELCDQSVDFYERELKLLSTCPVPSVVRDVHLERIIRAELKNPKSDEKTKISRGDKLLSFFSNRDFTGQYAGEVLKMRLNQDPEIIKNPDKAIDFICTYLPGASLKRNYYLSLIEENSHLDIATAEKIKSLRMTEELESQTGDGYYNMSVVNMLSEQLDRTQKRKTVLWLLKMYNQKSEAIDDLEEKYNGKLESVQTLFFSLTPDEREEIIKKFLVGEQGLIDDPPSEMYSKESLKEERDTFFNRLAEEFIPDSTPSHPLLRKLFVTVLSEAQPVRSAQIVTNLLNKFIDAKISSADFTPEEALATALCSLGIVGKKAAQSISELSWIDEGYKEALREAQENADTVPKHGLIEIARQNGLLEETSPVQIISINELLGAASNKQSALIETRINDENISAELGIEPGSVIELVGKFKRPSAQKTENINHDIGIMSKIMDLLREEGYGNSLPEGFASQIENIIRRELKFESELDFNHKLSTDLEHHGTFKGYSVGVPKIVFSTPDVILETRAAGQSLRKIIDENKLPVNEVATIKTVILRELLFQLQSTGNIHGDLHPANIFVDMENKQVTLIDLGLNVSFDSSKRIGIRRLLQSVATGNSLLASQALDELGWHVDEADIQLRSPEISQMIRQSTRKAIDRRIFGIESQEPQPSYKNIIAENLHNLVQLARKYNPPDDIATLIFASSKLEPYLEGVKAQDVISIIGQIALTNVTTQLRKRIRS